MTKNTPKYWDIKKDFKGMSEAQREAFFWQRLEKQGDCFVWTGAQQKGGYGHSSYKSKPISSHRLAYFYCHGELPVGLVLDHHCRNRLCANPEHLEPVTNKENILRGEGITAQEAKKTHCKQGHEFNTTNTYFMKSGGRACDVCRYTKNGYSLTKFNLSGVKE